MYIDATRGSAYGMGMFNMEQNTQLCNQNFTVFNELFGILLKLFFVGQEDIKMYMDERRDDEFRLGQLSAAELFQLHILIEQASHEIRQKRPEVRRNQM